LSTSIIINAQNTETDNVKKTDSIHLSNYNKDEQKIAMHKAASNRRVFIGKVRGFRVQIYCSDDRKKANQAKLQFMQSFLGIRSYLSYVMPQFRVRVGDFRSKREAIELYRKLSKDFPNCMIVPDIVNVRIVESEGYAGNAIH
jgi:hypothetical protein